MVSDSTNVPETNETPTTTAITVSSSRSLLTSRLRSETRSTSASQTAHDVEDGRAGGSGELLDDRAVDQEHDPVGVRRGPGVVGHHDDGLAELVDHRAEEPQELGAGPLV